jgi:hypothetical protein
MSEMFVAIAFSQNGRLFCHLLITQNFKLFHHALYLCSVCLHIYLARALRLKRNQVSERAVLDRCGKFILNKNDQLEKIMLLFEEKNCEFNRKREEKG